MAFDMLVGNETLRARLEANIRVHALAHAYLIEGAEGSGRRTLATALCAALACEASEHSLPCGRCAACRKVLEGKSPDVIRITCGGKTSIGVDDVRFLRADVLVPPNDLENKIYIIEEADKMTTQAQNALLLTLEEPPPYVLFLLLCESATGMLDTIRSRAPLLRLEPVRRELMKDWLCGREPSFAALSEKEQTQILLLADGSIGRALVLSDPKERQPLLERRALAASYVEAVLKKREDREMPELTAAFGSKRDEVTALMADILAALRDLILLKRSDAVILRFYTDREAASELCEQVSMQMLLSLYDTVETTRGQLLHNANVRLALTALFLLNRT